MAAKRLPRVREWIVARGLTSVEDHEFATMQRELVIPEAALRRLLREVDVPMSPVVEGVRQDTFENLARTLSALQREYESGDRGRRAQCRNLVITAKDHARLASRKTAAAHKAEMVEWMLVWLENPPLFETWLKVRRK